MKKQNHYLNSLSVKTGEDHTYQGQYWQFPTDTTDGYGKHKNACVVDKMFYLLAAGGFHNSVGVQGIGVENAFKVMFKANRTEWHDTTTFWSARYGCMSASLTLDPSRQWVVQVGNAWNAVGVCDTCQYVPGDANGDGAANQNDVTFLVRYFKGLENFPDSCYLPFIGYLHPGADYNGDCQILGGDVSYAVGYFKGNPNMPYIKWCLHFTPQAP